MALSASPALAAPPITFATPGTGAGQVEGPGGIAVDQSSGDVYVADGNNFRIDRFDSSGGFLMAWGYGVADGHTLAPQTCGPEASPPTTRCFAGEGASTAVGPGSVNPQAVAVDQSTGDVYVVEQNKRRVSKFGPTGQFLLMFGKNVDTTPATTHPNLCTAAALAAGDVCGAGAAGTGPGEFSAPQSLAVESSGRVWVGDENRLEQFNSDGTFAAQIPLAGAGRTNALAIDSAGDFYVKSQSLAGIRKLAAATGTLITTLDASGSPIAVAVDSADDVYVGDKTSPYRFMVFDAGGQQISQFGGGGVIGSPGSLNGNPLAVGGTAHALYVASSALTTNSAAQIFPLPEPGPLPQAQHVAAIAPTTATLAATLNPEGHATAYRFEYGTDGSYGEATATVSLPGSAFGDETVAASIDHLTPATTYHFRLVATNNCNPVQPGEECTVRGEDATFTTPPAVQIDAQWATDVAGTAATFNADLNPLAAAAGWWVEYGTAEGYGSVTPEAGLAAGSGDVTVSIRAQQLEPGTTYHYRFAARDERDGVAYVVHGEDRTLTTQLGGLAFWLPDGRAWELVSPANKGGGRITPASQGVVQASRTGDAITYLANGAIEAAPQGSRTPEFSQLLARHSEGGWGTGDITTVNSTASPYELGHGWEYRFFTPDLSTALVEPHSGLPLSPEASERTPYLRDNNTQGGAYRPLLSGKEGFANVPPGTEFGGSVLTEGVTAVSAEGSSEDLGHVVLNSSVPLAVGAVRASLYEWTAGSLQLISVLPAAEGGAAVAGRLGAGGKGARHAVSEDGRYVFWTGGAGVGVTGSALYLRDTAAAATARLDLAVPGASGTGGATPVFQGADAAGTRAFFTDTQRLTVDSGASSGNPDLYECEVVEQAGKPACKLSDLTAAAGGEAAGVQGLVASLGGGGTDLYFVANGALAPGASSGDCKVLQGITTPSSATCNLYLDRYDGEAWKTSFLATLSNEDSNDWAGTSAATTGSLSAGSSPDGRYLAFMSSRGLTGYDNVDAVSGVPDEEVYLYDAVAEKLACVSCNPTQARPVGALDRSSQSTPSFADPGALWKGRWLAASLPDPVSLSAGGAGTASPYLSRYVLDDGRVFFNAADSLVPADANAAEDLYEYEPGAAGGCEASAAVARAEGGCVALISSGASAEESGFLDADAGGEDAFFLTAAKLSAQDTDAAYDVYDAHVCGLGWQCPAPAPAPPAPCASSGSCHPSTAATEASAPGSSAFSGPGNVKPRRHKKSGKRLHRQAKHRKRAAGHRRGGGK